jgi:hypothetical protein
MTTKAFAPGFARIDVRCSSARYAKNARPAGVDRWLSAAVALSRVIVPLAFFGVIAGRPIWTFATSVVLTRKELQ